MRRLIAMLALGAGLMAQEKPAQSKPAQDKPAEPNSTVPRPADEATIIPVKILSGDSFNRLVKLLNVFQARISADERLRTIVVYAPPDVVAHVKRVVAELDRPGSEAAIGRNIDVTLSFLRCSPKAAADAGTLPADLQGVAKQLRAATQCQDVILWYVLPMRIQEGKGSTQTDNLPLIVENLPDVPSRATIQLHPTAVTRKDSGRYVRFDKLVIDLNVPRVTSNLGVSKQWQYSQVIMETAGEFKEGQKSVIGKLSGVEPNTSLFVVVELKVLD